MVTSITLLGPRLMPSELQKGKHDKETRLKQQVISENRGKIRASQAMKDLAVVADWLRRQNLSYHWLQHVTCVSQIQLTFLPWILNVHTKHSLLLNLQTTIKLRLQS